jgi:hypothetical protein
MRMRNLAIVLTAAAAVAAGTPVAAQAAPDGFVRVHRTSPGCGIYGLLGYTGPGTEAQYLVNHENTGYDSMRCVIDDTGLRPSKTLRTTDFACGGQPIISSTATLTPNGRMTVLCRW